MPVPSQIVGVQLTSRVAIRCYSSRVIARRKDVTTRQRVCCSDQLISGATGSSIVERIEATVQAIIAGQHTCRHCAMLLEMSKLGSTLSLQPDMKPQVELGTMPCLRDSLFNAFGIAVGTGDQPHSKSNWSAA